MFNKKETLERLRIIFTEAYKKSLDIVYGANAWERIKLMRGMTDCQMEVELDECREYYIKEFSEAELFRFSRKSNKEMKNFFLELLWEAQFTDINGFLFSESANQLLI